MRGSSVSVKEFGGTNTDMSGQIPDNNFQRVYNMWVTLGKTLRAREGIQQWGNYGITNGSLVGRWRTSTAIDRWLASTTAATYEMSKIGAAGSNISAFPTHLMLQWNDLAFLFREDTTAIRTWNGTAITATLIPYFANVGIVHKNRMFTVSNKATGVAKSQLRYTDIFDINAPNTLAGWTNGGTISVQTSDADWITAVAVMNDTLYIFKSFSTWVLYTDGVDTSWTLRNIHPSVGCIGRDTPVVIGGLMYFLSAQGVYRTDGTTFERISDAIPDRFDNLDATTYVSTNDRSAVWYKNLYILNNNSSGGELDVYNIDNGAWTQWNTVNPLSRIIGVPDGTPPYFVGMYNETSGVLARYIDSNTYKDYDGALDYTCSFLTKYYDFDKPDVIKYIPEVSFDMNFQIGITQSVTCTMFVDGNVTAGGSFQVQTNDSDRRLYRFTGPKRCRILACSAQFVPAGDIELNSINFVIDIKEREGRAS